MTQEELQRKYDHLLNLVRKMRGWQKEYYKYHASIDLKKAKYLEREVDILIDVGVKAIKSNQKELF